MGVQYQARARASIPTSAGVGMAVLCMATTVGGVMQLGQQEIYTGSGLIAGTLVGSFLWSHFVECKTREWEATHQPAQQEPPAPVGFKVLPVTPRQAVFASEAAADGMYHRIDFESARAEIVDQLTRRVVEQCNYSLTYDSLRNLKGWPVYGKDGDAGMNTAIDRFRQELQDRGFAVGGPRNTLKMTGAGKKYFRDRYKLLPH